MVTLFELGSFLVDVSLVAFALSLAIGTSLVGFAGAFYVAIASVRSAKRVLGW